MVHHSPLIWTPEHLDEFAPSVAVSPFGPLGAPADVLAGAYLYELAEGRRRALVAVRPLDQAHGRRLDVVGLVSTGDRMPAAAMGQALDLIATEHAADMLAMCTQRAHIVRQASRQGWCISGVVMQKRFPNVRQ